ncbi:unnamed protein product [Debaryomyces tyrocola]|nr:unnamed protein product [Debaryomyces tyrocola]
MSQHQALDTSLWNKFIYGKPRMPNLEEDIEKGASEGFYDEKQGYSDDGKVNNEYSEPIIVKARKRKGIVGHGMILIGLVLTIFLLRDQICLPKVFKFHPCHGAIGRKSPNMASYVDESFGISNTEHANGTVPTRQVIEVSNPNVPRHSYGELVHSASLVKHTFGDSWGTPVATNYTPPSGVEFNRVVLTLNTSVEGVQYDRLANIFVDGAEIWRTSTAEPGGRAVFSTFKKDVSSYLKLFTKESKILFQLDNILSGRLSGEFEVELFVDFYNVEEHHHEVDAFLNEEDKNLNESIFSVAKPASQIHALTNSKDTETSPISYLPSDKLIVNLPSVPVNTTRLKLSIFTSGSAAEEFWYANVLDKYVRKFEKNGRALQGHGPVRIVNVYFNGEKIATQSPQPIIFSGGVSPALWSPVMPHDSFDLPSIDLDLSGLLPYLWENQSIEDKNIEIEIANGLDETAKPNTPRSNIGDNWITTANLLTYENKDVADVSGDIIKIDHSQSARVIDFAPPFTGSIQQTISASFDAELTSNLNFVLKDGSTLNTTVSSISEAKISNVQSYRHFGDNQKVVHLGSSSKTFTIQNVNPSDQKVDDSNIIHNYKSQLSYPLTISLDESDQSEANSLDLEYDAKIAHAKEAIVNVDGKNVMSTATSQNGKSRYVLSHEGNHGFGDLETKYKLNVVSPTGAYNYKRKVTAVNGTIISDKNKSGNEEHSDLHSYRLLYKIPPKRLHRLMKLKKIGDEYDNVVDVLSDIYAFKSTDIFICKQLRDTLNAMRILDLHREFIIVDESGNVIKIGKDRHHQGKMKHQGGKNKHHGMDRHKVYGMKHHGGKHHDNYDNDDQDKPSKVYGMKHQGDDHRPRPHGGKHHDDSDDDEEKPSKIYGMKHYGDDNKPRPHGGKHHDDSDDEDSDDEDKPSKVYGMKYHGDDNKPRPHGGKHHDDSDDEDSDGEDSDDEDKPSKAYGMKYHGDDNRPRPHGGKHHDDSDDEDSDGENSDEEDKPSKVYGMKYHGDDNRPRPHGGKHHDDIGIPPQGPLPPPVSPPRGPPPSSPIS